MMRHRIAVLVVTLAIPAILGSRMPTEFDNSLRIWFLDDDPDVQAYDEFLEVFETDEFVAVAFVADDVFAADVIRDVDRLTTALEELERVTHVTSVTTAEAIELIEEDGWRTLRTEQLVDQLPTTEAELERLRERVHGDRLLRDMVAEDDSATLLFLQIPHFEDLEEKYAVSRNIFATAAEVVPDREIHVAGTAVVDETMQRYSQNDMALFGPLTTLVILIITFLLFRNWSATLLPQIVIGLTMISTAGLAGWLGVKLTIVTSILVPLGLAVGVADSVHVISGYRERLQDGLAKAAALRSAYIELFLPCWITTITTAAGLGSLLVATLEPLRQFGWMGAALVCFALLYTLTVLPITLSYLPAIKFDAHFEGRWFTRLLSRIARFSFVRAKIVLAFSLVLGALAVLGVVQLRAGADFQSYYHHDDPVLVAARLIDGQLGGTVSVEVFVEADDVRSPEVLAGFEQVEDYFATFGAIGTIMSPATLVKTLNERYFGDAARFVVPGTLAASAQLLELVIGDQIYRDYLTTDATAGRLSARINATQYHELVDRADEAERMVAGFFGDGVDARLTGYGKLMINLDGYIITSQIRSILLAFAIVGLSMCLMFKSLRFGLFAFIPNMTPLLLVLGAMGWLDLKIDVATVMIGSILLGLIVDDTVHFLARYRLEERRALDEGDPNYIERGLRAAGVSTGRALLSTTVILACAFWTQLFASFRVNQTFGLLAGIAIVIALFCDLVVLPAVIRLAPMKRWIRHPNKDIANRAG